MNTPVKVLIVEDEMIIAAKISMHLSKLGYEVSGIIPRGEEAVVHCRENPPDILLLDIKLKGEMSGIETAKTIQKEADIPIIYLTANADDTTFDEAKQTRPFAFLSKPYKKLDLQRAMDLVVNRIKDQIASNEIKTLAEEDSYILSDRIFIRHKEKMVKLFIKDILYVIAERSYCRIFSKDTEYLLSIPLKNLEEKLQADHLMRIHRSYIVNLQQIDEVAESFLKSHQILVGVKYFTSRVSNSPDKEKRQRTYLDAIQSTKTQVIYGHYKSKPKQCHSCGHNWNDNEEKMTDVNIAVAMIVDAMHDKYDTAFLISGDSDLVPLIRAIHSNFKPKRVLVAFPPNRHNNSVKNVARGSFMIGKSSLRKSQFANKVTSVSGFVLSCTPEWK